MLSLCEWMNVFILVCRWMSSSWRSSWRRSLLSSECERNSTQSFPWVTKHSLVLFSHLYACTRTICCSWISMHAVICYPNAVIFLSDLFCVRTLQSTEPGGHFICTVYLEEKKDTAEQHVKVTWTSSNDTIFLYVSCFWHLVLLLYGVQWDSQGKTTGYISMKPHYLRRLKLWGNCCFPSQIPGSMTAAELTCEVLDRRNITVKDKEYWNCWEVSDKEEMGEKEAQYLQNTFCIYDFVALWCE